ncbi:hypothetical protein SAMN05444579_10468 [Delftia tsuruhatensis]|nr:hypothetical protein SAMN05444579_10468 [Delftia tsuruhatensis]
MIVVPPMPITAAGLIDCSVPEVDASAGEKLWSPTTHYERGAQVLRLETQMRYENSIAGVDATPPEQDARRWMPLRPSNRWAMFRHLTNDATEAPATLSFTLRPGKRFDTLFMRGVQADKVVMQVKSAGAVVAQRERKLNARATRTWSGYFFGEFPLIPTVLISDLPPFTGAEIVVTLVRAGGRPVRVEHAALGMKSWIGDAEWAPRNDALNFSVVDRDKYGGIKLQPVRSVPTLSVKVRIPKDNVDTALRLRRELDAAPALWAALDDDTTDGYAEAASIFGPYRRFPIDLNNAKDSYSHIDLESM